MIRAGLILWMGRRATMGEIDRRDLIKSVAIGGAALGLGSAVVGKSSTASAAEKPGPNESSDTKRIPETITSCECKKVVLKLTNLDPRFGVCHCDTCQLVHNGPWYGTNCSDIEIIGGKEHVALFPLEHGEVGKVGNPQDRTIWHFCSNCGSRLYYRSNGKKPVNKDRYNASVGLVYHLYPKEMLMEKETFYGMKPAYYSFHESKKYSSG
jgi:hypothetical protein